MRQALSPWRASKSVLFLFRWFFGMDFFVSVEKSWYQWSTTGAVAYYPHLAMIWDGILMKSFAGFLQFLMAWCLHKGFLVEVGDKISLFPPMPILPPSEEEAQWVQLEGFKRHSIVSTIILCASKMSWVTLWHAIGQNGPGNMPAESSGG